MILKRSLSIGLAAGVIAFAFAATGIARAVIVPCVPCPAEADHYDGAACVQMAIKNCSPPSTATQEQIFNRIQAHNTEPTLWFGDPNGIRGALGDPLLSPCGHWAVGEAPSPGLATKEALLGMVLYWMEQNKYLTPVCIAGEEHWVVIVGLVTTVNPDSSVTITNVLLYDPRPGVSGFDMPNASDWFGDPNYWGSPLTKTGSAWNGKYVAVYEPPPTGPKIVIPKRILEGPILPPREILRHVHMWLEEIRGSELARGPLEVLQRDIKPKAPVLVNAGRYSYYLVAFDDSRLAAVFNAYDGSFEQIRYFDEPQRLVPDHSAFNERLREALGVRGAKVVEIERPELRYDPEAAPLGRLSPTWEARATVRDARGVDYGVSVSLNAVEGPIRGLERIQPRRGPIPPR